MDRSALDRSLAYVDSWLRWRIARVDVPGCTVAVSLHGEVLLSAAYGCADVGKGRPMRPDDVFRIASHSKTFTATAVMQLVEAGRLRLDDPVAAHVRWLDDHPDVRWRRVTVRQLLSHGAGMVRDGLDSDFWQYRRPFPDAVQLHSEVLDAPLVTEPEVALKYSNFGYGLLGEVIEAAAGRPFADHVEEHITRPLGLAATSAEPRGELAERVVTGYGRRRPDGSRLALPPVSTGALAPATGFSGTAPELCRFLSAHLCGTGLLLSDASKREMQRVHWHAERLPPGINEDYGLGFILERIGARRTVGHSGGFPGQVTRSLVDPADGIAVAVLTNCIDGPASDVVRGILTIIDAFTTAPTGSRHRSTGGGPAAEAGASGATESTDLTRFEGRFVSLWAVRDVVAAGQTLLVAGPDSWSPLADPDLLEVVDSDTLRIAETSSFGSAGELVVYGGGTVTWAGATHWPEDRWAAAEEAALAPPTAAPPTAAPPTAAPPTAPPPTD